MEPFDKIKRIPFYRECCPTCGHVYKIRICAYIHCRKKYISRTTQMYCSRSCKSKDADRKIKKERYDKKYDW